MKVKVASSIGFCGGVTLAINELFKLAKTEEKKIYLLFPPVHNERVSHSLEKEGLIILQGDDPYKLIEQAKDGLLVLGAHGHPLSYEEHARKLGIPFIDLTCPIVKAREQRMRELSKTSNIIYIGEKGHQECEAALSISPNIFLYEKGTTNKLPINTQEVYLFSQTTLKLEEINEAILEVKNVYPNVIVEASPCPSTIARQKLLDEIPSDSKLIIALGSKTSRNSMSLYSSCKEKFLDATVINALDKDELKVHEETLKKFDSVYLLSGTSSDLETINEVKEYLLSL